MRYFLLIIAGVLAGCGGSGVAPLPGAAPVQRLFQAGIATPPTTTVSEERTMFGNLQANGTVTAMSGINSVNNPSATTAYDGRYITKLAGVSSRDYDLATGAARAIQGQEAAFFIGNNNYMRYGGGRYAVIGTFSQQGNGFQQMGAIAMGNRTVNAGNLPATATYTGEMLGQFVGASNTPYDTSDTPILNANFTAGSVTMTGAPLSYNALNGNVTPATGLAYTAIGNISGTSFQGTMNANLGGLTGTFSGDFYGPNGEQAAGTFGMQGPSGSHVGAFSVLR